MRLAVFDKVAALPKLWMARNYRHLSARLQTRYTLPQK